MKNLGITLGLLALLFSCASVKDERAPQPRPIETELTQLPDQEGEEISPQEPQIQEQESPSPEGLEKQEEQPSQTPSTGPVKPPAPPSPPPAPLPPARTPAPPAASTPTPPRETRPAQSSRLLAVVIYSEGDVARLSKGMAYDVYPGDEIQPFDTIETGPQSYAEIEFTGPGLGSLVVTMQPNTSFYFEGSYNAQSSQAILQVITGQMKVSVNNLAGGSKVDARTRTVVLGVRGTIYNVHVSPGDNLLVSCETGEVEALGAQGERVLVSPGQGAQGKANGSLGAFPLRAGEEQAYSQNWFNIREMAELKQNAVEISNRYASSYESRVGEFEQKFRALEEQIGIFENWNRILSQGRTLSMGQLVRDKKVVGPLLLSLKKSLFFLERDIAQIEVFIRALRASGNLESGVQNTLVVMGPRVLETKRQLSVVRWAMGVFSRIDPGSPLGDFFGEGEEDSSEFFDSTDGFFD